MPNDNKTNIKHDGYSPLQKGYSPKPQGGYQPPTTHQTTNPPNTGSGVPPKKSE